MKKAKIDWERGINALADAVPYGHLLATTDPLELFMRAARRIKELEVALGELQAKLADERRCETCRHVAGETDPELGTTAWCKLESDTCAVNGFYEWEAKDV